MLREQKIYKLMEHPMIGSLFKKLTKAELETCKAFLSESEHLNDDDFALKCNRWMLDQPKPKNYSTMWAIVSQCK